MKTFSLSKNSHFKLLNLPNVWQELEFKLLHYFGMSSPPSPPSLTRPTASCSSKYTIKIGSLLTWLTRSEQRDLPGYMVDTSSFKVWTVYIKKHHSKWLTIKTIDRSPSLSVLIDSALSWFFGQIIRTDYPEINIIIIIIINCYLVLHGVTGSNTK